MCECSSLVQHRTVTPLTQIRFPGATRDFSPRVNFQCRFSWMCPYTPLVLSRACTHVKDPVVHVRVRWIMETLEHPTCTAGWIARLCRSWLSSGKATRISHGRNPKGKYSSKSKSPRCFRDSVALYHYLTSDRHRQRSMMSMSNAKQETLVFLLIYKRLTILLWITVWTLTKAGSGNSQREDIVGISQVRHPPGGFPVVVSNWAAGVRSFVQLPAVQSHSSGVDHVVHALPSVLVPRHVN